MFGQTSTFGGGGGFGGFGASQSAQPSTGFGSSFSFGSSAAPSTSTFGSFGAPAAGGFGQTAQPSTGLFGAQPQQQQQPASTGFGGFGGSTFGGGGFGSAAQQQQPAFGAASNSGFGGFGASTGGGFGSLGSSFGSTPATQSSFSLGSGFGSNTAGSSLFSNSGPSFGGANSGFGASQSLFGGSTSSFGSTPSTFSLSSSQPSLFGTQPTTGAFGGSSTLFGQSPAPAFGQTAQQQQPTSFGGFGGFGQTSQQPQQPQPGSLQPAPGQIVGSRLKRFEPVTEKSGVGDKAVTAVYQSLAAMPEYENKSFEELRWEDTEIAGPAGLSSANLTFLNQSTPFGGFAQQQSQQSGGSLFNQPSGGTGFGLFAQQQTSSLFSQPQSSSSLFSTSTAPSSTLFSGGAGAPFSFSSTAGSFGVNSQSALPTSSGFPSFGTNNFASGQSSSGFSSSFNFPASSSTGGLFSQPSSGFSGFPSSQPAASSSSFSFGPQSGSTTSQPAQSTLSFPASSGSSLFSGGGLFNPSSASTGSSFAFPSFNSQSSGSLFGGGGASGSQLGQTGSLFSNNSSFGLPSFSSASSSPFGTSLFGQPQQQQQQQSMLQLQGQQQQQQQAQPTQVASVDENPYMSNFLSTSTQNLLKTAVGLSAHTANAALQSPSSLASSASGASSSPPPLNALSSTNALVRLSGSLQTPRSAARMPARRYLNTPSPTSASLSSLLPVSLTPNRGSPGSSSALPQLSADLLMSRRTLRKLTSVRLPPTVAIADIEEKAPQTHKEDSKEQPQQQPDMEEKKQASSSPAASSTFQTPLQHRPTANSATTLPDESKQPTASSALVPRVTRPHYSLSPPLSTLASYTPAQLRAVQEFTVSHAQLGSVQWVGLTDVTGLDVDSIVIFEQSASGQSSVEVYPNESQLPPVGRELNKEALVTLRGCWPGGKGGGGSRGRVSEDRVARYKEKLRQASEAAGAKFIGYDERTGEWKFKVDKFS